MSNNNRHFLIGLDKPQETPLSASSAPMAKLRLQAQQHERLRLESASEMLGLVGILCMHQALSGFEVVTVRGAIYQWGQGVKADRTVGAHCLPGQIRFNENAPHQGPSWKEEFLIECGLKPLALASKLRNLSARVQVADSTINSVDSLLEKMGDGRGLKPLFANESQYIMLRTRQDQQIAAAGLTDAVRSAMDHYRAIAFWACLERQDWLRQQMQSDLKSGRSSEAEKRRCQLLVIEEYLSVLSDHSFSPFFATLTGVMALMRDVIATSR